jgi:formylmethanofuran dehydrogenase subunit C
MSEGLTAHLKSPLTQPADFGEVFVAAWSQLDPAALAHRPVYLSAGDKVTLGDLFDIQGTARGRIRFEGDLTLAVRFAAGLAEGEVTVDGSVGPEAGSAMSGGALIIEKNAGARVGAAPQGVKRGMSGGELIVRGSAGPEAGAAMRRGLLAIGRTAGERTGLGMIAGTVVVFGDSGAETGLWSKRGSVVALGPITPPATYAYACTYQPIHVRLQLSRLKARYALPVQRRHLTGFYRRYSGDLAERARGEILQWTAK